MHVRLLQLFVIFFISLSFSAPLPGVEFTSSNLPIIKIDTHGQRIPYDNPRISADMQIIYNGAGEINRVTDPPNEYDGNIDIEIRGHSSAGWAKKQYAIETQKDDGSNRNVNLFGFGGENDWVLNGPYIDKSFLRNVLAYKFSRELGQYASRTRYCELILNGTYQGLYIFMEKIKRDDDRIDIAELDSSDTHGSDVTGGYILKIDKIDWEQDDGWSSQYLPLSGSSKKVFYIFHDPKHDELVKEQKNYIHAFMDEFEQLMKSNSYADSISGYTNLIDVKSFIDYLLVNEISKNVDGYRLSTYMYKRKDTNGGKLYMGPVWDFNLAFGLADYYDAHDTDGWMVEELSVGQGIRRDNWQTPFWWMKLVQDPRFCNQLEKRWVTLRQNVFDIDRIHAYIEEVADTLEQAKERNFELWTGPGEKKAPGDGFWPVPDVFYTFETYQDEIDFLKDWIKKRIIWMDNNMASLSDTEQQLSLPNNFELYANYPNPFNTSTTIRYTIPYAGHLKVTIYDGRGRRVKTLVDDFVVPADYRIQWHGRNEAQLDVASGVYMVRVKYDNLERERKILLLR